MKHFHGWNLVFSQSRWELCKSAVCRWHCATAPLTDAKNEDLNVSCTFHESHFKKGKLCPAGFFQNCQTVFEEDHRQRVLTPRGIINLSKSGATFHSALTVLLFLIGSQEAQGLLRHHGLRETASIPMLHLLDVTI